jgi:hypothetical protein
MKQLISLLAVFFAMAFPLIAQESDKVKVLETFTNYKSAILNDKGEAAVKLVDSRTIKYYDKMAQLSRDADSASIEEMSILDKLMLLSIRHRAPKADIKSFDGRKLLLYAIKNGMVGKNSVANNTLGEITVNADYAQGQLVANEKKTPLYFNFYREDSQWKLDLTSIFSASTAVMNKMVERSGKTEDDFIFDLLEQVSGRRPKNDIWKPIR